MLKITTSLVAVALAFAPAAVAEEGEEITVQFEYDGTLLPSEAGAETVIASLKDQAKDACSYKNSLTYTTIVDRSCVKTTIASAAAKIVAEREAAGLETAAIFEQQATVVVAALD